MKKFVSIASGLLTLAVIGAAFAGVTPSYLVNSPAMLTGMGAKLACSGRYVSGLSESQAFIDLQSYSAVLKLLDLDYDDASKTVSASLLGLKTTQAKHRPGIGCALSVGDTSAIDGVIVKQVKPSAANWPMGDSAEHINSQWQQQLDQLLIRDNQAALNTRALLVVHDGQLVAESYAPGFDSSSKLLGWSMAKSVTALLIGHLEMTERLDLDQKPVFTSWAKDERAEIDIEDLLHMSSGLEFPETYEPGAGATDMLFRVHRASDLPLAAPSIHRPGEYFEYSSGTTNLLSKLIFDISGASAQQNFDFMDETLIAPLNLRDFVFETDPSGMSVGSSYLYASAREWAKIGQLMLNEGELNGHRLVTQDWVARAQQPNLSSNTRSYGYQFWLNRGDENLRWNDLPDDSYAALGNRKQVVMMIPSENTVIVRLGWTSSHYPTNNNFAEIMSWITKEPPAV
ncbi:MAG: serine hydrolase domain-containing protein [Cellvibrionaceae bacterium]